MRLAVLASGTGSILDAMVDAGLPVNLVVTDRPCLAVQRAAARGIRATIVGRGSFGDDFDRDAYTRRLVEVLVAADIGLAEQLHEEAGLLSHGQKQWLEIGMLLMQRPRLLLVDEPVAGMTEQEMERTAELLTGLAGKQSVVVVEHDMGFVRSIARKVTVLHQGSVLAEGSMDQVSNDPKVVEVYLGSDEEESA